MIEHRYVTVCGVRVHYVQAGTGNPLVLLHGLGASWITWSLNIEPQARHFTVYALDLPGHGDSDKPEIDYSIPSGVRFIQAFLNVLKLDRVALVGNSIGGLFAFRVAREAPQKVSQVVLVGAAGLGREVSWGLRFSALPLIGELLHIPNVVTLKGLARGLFYQPQAIERQILEELRRVRNQSEARRAVIKAIRSGIHFWGMKREFVSPLDLNSLTMPVLVVWGAQDRILPVQHAYQVARECPRVRVEVFPQCGHWPQMEKAEEFNQLLPEFLRGSTAKPVGRHHELPF